MNASAFKLDEVCEKSHFQQDLITSWKSASLYEVPAGYGKAKEPGAASVVLTMMLGGREFKFSCNLVFIPLLQGQASISVKT